jgi:hypothetical protein
MAVRTPFELEPEKPDPSKKEVNSLASILTPEMRIWFLSGQGTDNSGYRE